MPVPDLSPSALTTAASHLSTAQQASALLSSKPNKSSDKSSAVHDDEEARYARDNPDLVDKPKISRISEWMRQIQCLSTLNQLGLLFVGEEGLSDLHTKSLVLISFLFTFAVMTVIQVCTGSWLLDHAALRPRQLSGLVGLIFAPFIHHDLPQLTVNLLPFTILGALVLMRRDGIRTFLALSAASALIAGIIVWCVGRDIPHVGSTCFIYSYFGFLLLFGVFTSDAKSVAVSIFVFLLYGSALWGVFPSSEQTSSWELNFFAMTVGMSIGWWLARFELGHQPIKDDMNPEKTRLTDSSLSDEETGLSA